MACADSDRQSSQKDHFDSLRRGVIGRDMVGPDFDGRLDSFPLRAEKNAKSPGREGATEEAGPRISGMKLHATRTHTDFDTDFHGLHSSFSRDQTFSAYYGTVGGISTVHGVQKICNAKSP
jgi:hypothetical protein